MNKLIVVTYKLPADQLTRKMYGDNLKNMYDCTAYFSNELVQPEIKKLKRKYGEDNVSTFVCNVAEYHAWVDDEDAWAEFVKTGVCPLRTSVNEDVDVGIESRTVNIQCFVKIQRETSDLTFDYHVDIDDVGQIVFTPCDVGTRFCHEEEEMVEGENVKFETVNLTAQMISESENYDYFTGIDDVGQFVITPDSDDTSFLSASVDDSLNLVTESAQEIVADPDYVSPFDIGDRVVVRDDSSVKSGEIIEFVGSDPMDDYTGAYSGDFSAWIVRFDDGTEEMVGTEYLSLENIDEECEGNNMRFLKEANKYRDWDWSDNVFAVVKNDGTYAGVPCLTVGEARELHYQHDGSKIFKLVLVSDPTEEPLEESLSEEDHMNIVNKVMRGELPIFSGEGDPDPSYVLIPELTNDQGPIVFEYYYDEESGEVVSYSRSKSLDNECL